MREEGSIPLHFPDTALKPTPFAQRVVNGKKSTCTCMGTYSVVQVFKKRDEVSQF
jgi:hypothetical protein